MTIYAFAGCKGGVGKTTLAFNAAVHLTSLGRRVLVVDTDKARGLAMVVASRSGQESLAQMDAVTLYADQSNPQYVAETLKRHAGKHDDIVIDCPPGAEHLELRSALMVADVLVSPCQPGVLDIRTMKDMDALVYQAKSMNPKLQAHIVLNRCSTNVKSSKAREAREMLSVFAQYCTMQTEIKNRDAFMESLVVGQAASEYQYSTTKARTEMNEFMQELFNHG